METYNIEIDKLIKYWKDALPDGVDYAEMVGAPAGYYGIKYVYEDPDGYFIEDTIKALEELKELRKLVSEAIIDIENNNNKLLNLIKITNIDLKEK